MGDMGDVFNSMKKAGQDKRKQNRQASSEILQQNGIGFEVKNQGAHLIVEGGDCLIDFWPGTGKVSIPRQSRGL